MEQSLPGPLPSPLWTFHEQPGRFCPLKRLRFQAHQQSLTLITASDIKWRWLVGDAFVDKFSLNANEFLVGAVSHFSPKQKRSSHLNDSAEATVPVCVLWLSTEVPHWCSSLWPQLLVPGRPWGIFVESTNDGTGLPTSRLASLSLKAPQQFFNFPEAQREERTSPASQRSRMLQN